MKKVAARRYYARIATAKLKWYKKYYANHREGICASRRGRYVLAEPKPAAEEFYVKEMQRHLLNDSGARIQLMKASTRVQQSVRS